MQTKWLGAHWQTTGQLILVNDMRYYRIHPNDEHLQYGPISTALREMAINDLWYPPSWQISLAITVSYGPISTALREMAEDYSWNSSWQISLAITVSLDVTREFSELLFSKRENEDYPLFYLFLAEFLADEGM